MHIPKPCISTEGCMIALLQISFVVSNPRPCGLDMNTRSNRVYKLLASISDGQLFVTSKSDVSQVEITNAFKITVKDYSWFETIPLVFL